MKKHKTTNICLKIEVSSVGMEITLVVGVPSRES
jgi:hypothetical protein